MTGFVFLMGSLGFVILSRNSFLNPRSHGFPRFFAFEAILGLVVLNAPRWFANPFSLLQLISWELLIDSAVLAAFSLVVLKKFGKPGTARSETNLVGFEKTTELVQEGPFRFIRHPMYASLLCLAWGVLLKGITLQTLLLTLVASLALFTAALFEERENQATFGQAYADYMKSTKRFIPFLF